MAEAAQKPWEGYKLYKVFHKGQGRHYANLVGPNDRHTTAFARYLMEVTVGRRLDKHETVDHINGDKSDDRIENLQILSWKDNIQKSVKPIKVVELVCDNCKKTFVRQARTVKSSAKKYTSVTCSRSCIYELMAKEPIAVAKTKKPIPHGTKSGYSYHKCRCDLCRDYNTKSVAARRSQIG